MSAMVVFGGVHRCPNKKGRTKLMAVTLSNLNRFLKPLIDRFSRKFAIKWLLEIPPHSVYVVTLPCENIRYQKLTNVHEMS